MLRVCSNNMVKEYKNGNITIKLDRDTLDEIKKDELLTLASILDEMDCYFIGESYCLSNFAMGHTVYNAYSDLCYVFPWCMLDELKAGKTVKLYAREPDEGDREILEREGF